MFSETSWMNRAFSAQEINNSKYLQKRLLASLDHLSWGILGLLRLGTKDIEASTFDVHELMRSVYQKLQEYMSDRLSGDHLASISETTEC